MTNDDEVESWRLSSFLLAVHYLIELKYSTNVWYNCLTLSNNSWRFLLQMSWKWGDNGKREIQKLAEIIWKRCSKQNWWNMLYLRVIPRKSRFYIKSQFWKSFHWGHFLSKDQLVPIAQWAEIFSEEGPYSIFLHFYKKFVQFS